MTARQESASAEEFYGGLAAHYHLLFADWDEALTNQGRVLNRLIRRLAGPGSKQILVPPAGLEPRRSASRSRGIGSTDAT